MEASISDQPPVEPAADTAPAAEDTPAPTSQESSDVSPAEGQGYNPNPVESEVQSAPGESVTGTQLLTEEDRINLESQVH